jgi:hypothetical protein
MKKISYRFRYLIALLVGCFAVASAATAASAATISSAPSSHVMTITVRHGTTVNLVRVRGIKAGAGSPGINAGAVSPDIEERSCSGHPNWVHLYLSDGASECFGFTGVIENEYWQSTGLCAGNNYGYVDWQVDGYDYVGEFAQGDEIGWGSPGVYVYEIEIDGYSGSDSC